jgi:hypothetical protein
LVAGKAPGLVASNDLAVSPRYGLFTPFQVAVR